MVVKFGYLGDFIHTDGKTTLATYASQFTYFPTTLKQAWQPLQTFGIEPAAAVTTRHSSRGLQRVYRFISAVLVTCASQGCRLDEFGASDYLVALSHQNRLSGEVKDLIRGQFQVNRHLHVLLTHKMRHALAYSEQYFVG